MSNFALKLWSNFLGFILITFHFAYSLLEYLDWGLLMLKRKSAVFLDLESFDAELHVSKVARTLKKRPSHLAILVGGEKIQPRDFSNLVLWCLAAKISFVSFYDSSGYLKANADIYYKYLMDKAKLDPNCVIFELGNSFGVNGVVHKIHLNILSLEDGKPKFVELARNLSKKLANCDIKEAEINEKLISREIYQLTGLPEPDLCVVSGSIQGTMGFLPWHIRVTEFLKVKSLKRIQVSEFTGLLQKYSSCNQRFGV